MATNDDIYNTTKSSLQSDNYAIFTAINEWERHSIGKIQLAAEKVRNELKRYFEKKREDVVNSLIQVNNEITQNSMNNIDLDELTREFQRFRKELSNLSSTIHLEHDKSQSPIYLITLCPKQNDQVLTTTVTH